MKSKFLHISLFVCLLIYIPSLSFAATYYMRADGKADSKANATSCSSAAKAMNVADHNREIFKPGDKIILCEDGGIYSTGLNTPSPGVTYSPAESDDIVFEGPGKGNAIIIDEDNITIQLGNGRSFEVKKWGDDTGEQIRITNKCDSAIVDGLIVHDSDGAAIGVEGNSTNAIIKNCKLYECGNGTEDEVVTFAGGATNCILQHSEIYGNSMRGIDGVLVSDAYYITIQYNFIHTLIYNVGEGAEQGVDIKGGSHHVYVQYNYFKDILRSGGVIVHSPYSDVHDIHIIGNKFENCRSYGVNLYPRKGHDAYNIYIVNNLFTGIEETPIKLSSAQAGDNWSNTHVINNTVVDCAVTSGNYLISINGASSEHGINSIKNNIFNENINGKSLRLLSDNDGSGKYTIVNYNRFYDSDGTAQCEDSDGKWQSCDSETVGSHNEIFSTKFIYRSNILATENNITPAEALNIIYSDGLSEDTDWSNVLDGSIYIVNRNNYNSGKWGKGAVVYGSSNSNKNPPSTYIQNPPRNLRLKTGSSGR